MIVIKDMEMPKKCGECDIYVRYRTWNGDPGDEFCGLTKEGVNYKTKPEWCPLSEVPERKTGKWEEENGSLWKDNRRTRWGCSACGKHVLITLYDNPIKAGLMFCPNCGAKMEE